MKRLCPARVAIGVFLFSAAAHASPTIDLEPVQDNTLYETGIDSGENLLERSNGQGNFLFVGRTGFDGGFKRRRAALKFDLGSLPPGATILAVELTLYQAKAAPDSPPATMNVFPLSQLWGEGESKAIAPEGQGDFAAEGDATWHHRLFPDTAWDTPGGSFGPLASASVTVGEDAGYFTWECTSQLLADVQAWQSDPAGNFGWIVVGGEEAGQSAHKFYSRENAAVSERPRLTILYRPADGLAEDGFEEGWVCGGAP